MSHWTVSVTKQVLGMDLLCEHTLGMVNVGRLT